VSRFGKPEGMQEISSRTKDLSIRKERKENFFQDDRLAME
jgi:hypothetical protein